MPLKRGSKGSTETFWISRIASKGICRYSFGALTILKEANDMCLILPTVVQCKRFMG